MSKPEEYWLEKAEKMKKQGKFEEYVRCMDKVEEIDDSQNEDYWHKRAVSFLEIKNYEEALKCFDNDLQTKKPNFESFFEKGRVLFLLKKYAEAVECFNKAWEIKYEDYLKFNTKGETLKNYKKFEKAVMQFDEAHSIDGIPESFWYLKGSAEFKIGEFQEGLDTSNEGLKQNPKDSELLYNKAKCLHRLKNKNDCFENLSNALRNEPTLIKKIETDEDWSADFKQNFLKNLR